MYGVDFTETFSPVAKLTLVRVFITLPYTHNLSLHQLDAKDAFLLGDLVSTIYLE